MSSRGPGLLSSTNFRTSRQNLIEGSIPILGSSQMENAAQQSGTANGRIRQVVGWLGYTRRNIGEWILVILILGALVYTELGASGRHMYITDFMLEQIKFPHVSGTIPGWSVPVYTLLGPPLVIWSHAALTNRDAHIIHDAILGTTFSTSVTALATNVFKLTVGRPRPDFFYRCFPDGVVAWKEEKPNGQRVPDCHPEAEGEIIDGYKSFPSGHTSWTFGAFTFLSLYLFFFLKQSRERLSVIELLIIVMPLLIASWVGMTRVIDNYHNPSDVVAGGLFGFAMAILTFFTKFPFSRLRLISQESVSVRETRSLQLGDGVV